MELAMILLKQVIIMLIYLCVGAVCYKTGLITVEGNKSLSNFVLYAVNPALIFVSYQQDFSMRLLKGLFATLILSTVGIVTFIIAGTLLIRKKEGRESGIERYSVAYSNCGFMGIPIASVLLGPEGVFYITAFNTVFNILIWTHGVCVISGDKKEMNLKKVILNPTIIATVLGFICFVLRLRLPEIPYTACSSISAMTAPLAMTVAGVTIARTDILKAVKKIGIYRVSALKLVIMPIVCILMFAAIPFDIDKTVVLTTVLALACPTATTCTMLTIKYGKNSVYAAEIFAVSTLLSVITLPLVIYVQGMFM